jgi:tripeptide aminopeptidase
MRSTAMQSLLDLEAAALQAVKDAVREENARWSSEGITADAELIGDRAAGCQPPDAPIIQVAILAVRAVGLKPVLEEPASTDSNVPISMGIPAVTLGRGGLNGDYHSLNEWFDPKDAYLGPQKNLLAVLALVGIDGVSQPILAKRGAQKN